MSYQFHQYQQNEQSSLIITKLTIHKTVGNSGVRCNPNNPVVIFHSLSIASLTEGGVNRRRKGLELFELGSVVELVIKLTYD